MPTPTQEGYVFDGWYNSETGNTKIGDGGETWTPTSATTLYAHWHENNIEPETTTYMVIHEQMNLDGKTYTEKERDRFTGVLGEKVTPGVKTYTGFTSPDKQTITLTSNENVIIYKYARNKYIYELENVDGLITQGSTESGSKYYGETIKLKVIENPGYTFKKWISSNLDLVENSILKDYTFTMPEGNIAITPIGILNTYTVSYNLNGGIANNNPTSYTVIAPEITLNNPKRDGYNFIGWTGSNGDVPEKTVKIENGSIGDKNFVANWEKIINIVENPEEPAELKLTIDYSTNVPTNKSVIVTIKANSKLKPIFGWTLSEDGFTLSKEYSDNRQEKVEVKDVNGIKKTVEINVQNIDKEVQKTGTDKPKDEVVDIGEIAIEKTTDIKKDSTTAKELIPFTGISIHLLFIILPMIGLSIFFFTKYRKLKNIL